MTHYTVSYKDKPNPQREATLDLVKWYGFRKSLILARYCAQIRRLMSEEYAKTKGWDGFRFPVSMSGVQGFPVWNAYERWTGITLPYEDGSDA